MIECLAENWLYIVGGIIFIELNLWYFFQYIRYSNENIARVLAKNISIKIEKVVTDISLLHYEYDNMNNTFQNVNEKLIEQLIALNKLDSRISGQVNEMIIEEVEKVNNLSSELSTLYKVQTSSVNSSINDLLKNLHDVKKDSTQIINLQGQIIKLEQRIKDFNK